VSATDESALLPRLQRLEALIQGAERLADPAARALVRELVQTLLDYHGSALAHLLACVAEAGESGDALLQRLVHDDLVSSLLLLYELHPLDLTTRVRHALEQVRPLLGSHGGDVELLGVSAEGVVRLRMRGNCHGCPSSAATLSLSIEEAIYQKAPDVAAIEVEGAADPPADGVPRLVPLSW
jgi:Fe-S cluster biogenesis protein NfuA